MSDMPKWMQPVQPAAGNDAAMLPASATPTPSGAAAEPRVTNAPHSPLHVGSPLDGLATPDAIKAAADIEQQEADRLAEDFEKPPEKANQYKFLPPPRDCGVKPMSPAEEIAVKESLHSLGFGEGLAQTFVVADYLARAPGAPREKAALKESSRTTMDKWAKETERQTGMKYEAARDWAERRAAWIDTILLHPAAADLMITDTSGRKQRIADYWPSSDVRNNLAVLKGLYARLTAAWERAARSS